MSGQASQLFSYDNIGNLRSKTGTGTGNYSYPEVPGSVRPHAVSAIPGIGSFDYDDNGNLISGAGRTLTWTSFDMPQQIQKITGDMVVYSQFVYGPEHQRLRQNRQDSSKTIYAGPQEVELDASGSATLKTYWPQGLGVEIDKPGAATSELYWTHVDRLGSIVAISDQTGKLKESLAYDAWGKRRTLDGAPINGSATPDGIDGQTDNKGYTGHEMLDQLDLVHMNGRIYDPLVARMMSADPFIQDPEHSQSYNRYTYVWNNPTNLTDPTGFLALSLGNRTVIYNEETVDTCAKGSTCYKDDGGGIHTITQVIDTDSKGRTKSADMTGGAGRDSSSPEGLKHRAEQLKNVVDHIGRLEENLSPKSWSEAGAGLQMHDQRMHFEGALEETVRKWRQVTPWDKWSKQDALDALDDGLMVLGSRMGGSRGVAKSARVEEPFGICFVAGTLVHTPTGLRRIEEIRADDEVFAHSVATGGVERRRVVRTFKNATHEVITVRAVDSKSRVDEIVSTPDHPYWVDGKGWIPAKQLKTNDLLRSIDGSTFKVESVLLRDKVAETFNFEVEHDHSYFVGEDGLLVHNQSKIDRKVFGKERRAYWKAEASDNAGAYSKRDLSRMQLGRPPMGSDGYPMELHHENRTMTGGLKVMTRTEHRLGDNYKKNHPD